MARHNARDAVAQHNAPDANFAGKLAADANFRWEFAGRDMDSDDDGEEPELVDGIDFNVYLIRRLHNIPKHEPLDSREFTAILAVEANGVRRSERLAGKRCLRAAFAPNPVVQGEQEYYDGEKDNEPRGRDHHWSSRG